MRDWLMTLKLRFELNRDHCIRVQRAQQMERPLLRSEVGHAGTALIHCSIPIPVPGPENDHREARPRSDLHGKRDMHMIRAEWREGVAKAQPELDQSGGGE
jgi:hypothetical protein